MLGYTTIYSLVQHNSITVAVYNRIIGHVCVCVCIMLYYNSYSIISIIPVWRTIIIIIVPLLKQYDVARYDNKIIWKIVEPLRI
jgi:hypothetical protein